MQAQLGVHPGTERGHHHLRAQVGAADADVDDVVDVTGLVATGTRADAFGKRQHAVELGVDSLAERPSPLLCAQGRVQCRAAFRDVDDVTAQQGVAAGLQAALAGQVEQVAARGHVPVRTRQVGPYLGGLQAQALGALGVVGEQLAQVQRVAMRFGVALQRRPRHRAVTAWPGGHGRIAVHAEAGAASCASISASSLAASAANRRMPSANFSVAMASSLSW